MTLALVADAAVACGDRDTAGRLYPRLLPYAGLNVAAVEWLFYVGSCGYFLGQLADLLGDRAASRAHFERALEQNAKLGARAALARTEFAYARLLLQDKGTTEERPTETVRARAMVREVSALAEELGMHGLLRDARQLAGE